MHADHTASSFYAQVPPNQGHYETSFLNPSARPFTPLANQMHELQALEYSGPPMMHDQPFGGVRNYQHGQPFGGTRNYQHGDLAWQLGNRHAAWANGSGFNTQQTQWVPRNGGNDQWDPRSGGPPEYMQWGNGNVNNTPQTQWPNTFPNNMKNRKNQSKKSKPAKNKTARNGHDGNASEKENDTNFTAWTYGGDGDTTTFSDAKYGWEDERPVVSGYAPKHVDMRAAWESEAAWYHGRGQKDTDTSSWSYGWSD